MSLYEGLDLDPAHQQHVQRTISSYLVGIIDRKGFRRRLHLLPPPLRDRVLEFKSEWLDPSSYCRRLWRAVYTTLSYPYWNIQRIENQWRVETADMRWVIDCLPPPDRLAAEQMARCVPRYEMSDRDVNEIIRGLHNLARGMVHGRIRLRNGKCTHGMQFILAYEDSVEEHDLIADMLTAAMLAIREVEHTGNRLFAFNTARRAVVNTGTNLIKHYTQQSRARLVPVADDTHREYRATTYSLDRLVNHPGTEEPFQLHEILAESGVISASDILDDYDQFLDLICELPPKVQIFARLVTGLDSDEQFELWSRENYGLSQTAWEEIAHQPESIAWYARRWLGLTTTELQQQFWNRLPHALASPFCPWPRRPPELDGDNENPLDSISDV